MPKQQSYDHLLKLLIVGDSGVGKTNILLRFCQDNFLNSHLTTIGIDFKTKTVDIEGKKIRLQIWDTAGQQRFKTITQTYYRGAMGIFLSYAINDRDSFNNIQGWLRQIKSHSSGNIFLILLGNKCDTPTRSVSYEEGKALADQIGAPFYQTSAKNDINIEQSFMQMAKQVKARVCSENQISFTSYTGSKLQKRLQEKDIKAKKQCC